jgi:hypothetical protein
LPELFLALAFNDLDFTVFAFALAFALGGTASTEFVPTVHKKAIRVTSIIVWIALLLHRNMDWFSLAEIP